MPKKLDDLAEKLQGSLRKDPTLTVPELAAEHEESEVDVVAVLDGYGIVDGKPRKGATGGWVPEPEPAEAE